MRFYLYEENCTLAGKPVPQRFVDDRVWDDVPADFIEYSGSLAEIARRALGVYHDKSFSLHYRITVVESVVHIISTDYSEDPNDTIEEDIRFLKDIAGKD